METTIQTVSGTREILTIAEQVFITVMDGTLLIMEVVGGIMILIIHFTVLIITHHIMEDITTITTIMGITIVGVILTTPTLQIMYLDIEGVFLERIDM